MTLLDPIRNKRVADTPEERVRQMLIRQMIGQLGFPKALLSVEYSLGHRRRADLVAFHNEGSILKPLLIIECKASAQKRDAYWQAAGYNSFLFAPFICLAASDGIYTYWKEEEGLKEIPFLPPYPQLIARIACAV